MTHKLAEDLFNQVYTRLSIQYDSIIIRETMHYEVYKEIVERCAMIASAHSRNDTDIGDLILKNMGISDISPTDQKHLNK